MKRSKVKIDSVIKKSKFMSLNSLKSELKIHNNVSLIRLLMNYLMSSIEEIDYSADVNDCYEVIRTLNYIKPETEEEFKLIDEYIKNLKNLIHKKKELLESNQSVLSLLTILEERLGSFLIETRFEMINNKDKIEKNSNIDYKKLKTIVCDYIFKYKDYVHLNMLVSLYPDICNIKYDDKTIVLKILKNYFSKPSDREFLSKVITLLISNAKFRISDEERNDISLLCDQYSNFLNLKDLIFIKEVITTLGIKQEINMEQKLSILKMRFGIQDFDFTNVRISNKHFPVDMTDRIVLTIDCADTLIRDDAFSIAKLNDGAYELGIYITDVLSIQKGSPLDIYAYNHFSTIYTKDTWIPMIPEPIVYNFSLDNGLRRAIAYTFRFSKSLELIDCEIAPALIKVRQNLSYAESANILDSNAELAVFLKDALDLSDAIGDSLGSVDRYHHIKEIVRELGESVSEIPEKYLDTPGNRIISTFAIFLNNYIATLFDKSNLPFIYRVNELESSESVQEQLKKYRHDKVICDMLKSVQSLYKPSTFSSINTGHKGLGLSAYTQATNPARLYPSLMIERMISDLFIYKIPIEEYIKKYQSVEGFARDFTALQQRNANFTNEYNKLCKNLTLERK